MPALTSLKTLIRRCLRHLLQRQSRQPIATIPAHYWGIEALENDLLLNGTSIREITNRYGTPNHLCNSQRLTENAQKLLQGKNQSKGHNQALSVYYSYKTHPVPGVLRQLHRMGIGAEVISEYELWLALELGVPANKIIYNGPAKSDKSIALAIRHGIRSLNANHPEELQRISEIAQSIGKPANLSLRLVPPGGWAGQFGFDIASGQAMAGFANALESNHLNVVGVHCHRGELFTGLEDLRHYLQAVTGFLDQLWTTLNYHPQIVDIGGSFPIPSVTPYNKKQARLATTFRIPPSHSQPEDGPDLAAYAQSVIDELQAWSVSTGRPKPEFVIEPGRALTGDTHLLLTQVVELRQAADGLHYAILDAGISAVSIIRTEIHQIFHLPKDQKRRSEQRQTYRLVGPICHMGDTLIPACELPQLAIGDTLIIMDTGAYCIPEARPFSFPRPGVIEVLPDGSHQIMRQAETFADIVSLDTDLPVSNP